MTLLSDAQVAEIKARAEAAKDELPWTVAALNPRVRGDRQTVIHNAYLDRVAAALDDGEIVQPSVAPDRAELIVAAVNALPKLLTDRDELVRRLAKVRERAVHLKGPCVELYETPSVKIPPHCHLCKGEWQPTCGEVHEPPDCPAAPAEGATREDAT